MCDGISGTITYDPSNPEFNIEGGISLGGCVLPINLDFQWIYLDDFWFIHQEDVFTYEIIDESNNSKTLTVTNIVGDQAIYGNEILSNDDFKISKFSIHPNPVKNKLFLNSESGAGDVNLKIFNVEGKLLNTQNLEFEKQVSVDVSNLSNGFYFLNIEDGKGDITIKKFIKE